jgi:hypothetical protein
LPLERAESLAGRGCRRFPSLTALAAKDATSGLAIASLLAASSATNQAKGIDKEPYQLPWKEERERCGPPAGYDFDGKRSNSQ